MPTTGAPLNLPLMALDGERLPSAKFNEAMNAINTGWFSGARVSHDANQSLTSGVETVIAFNRESLSSNYDTASYHSTSTNNSRLTVPAIGYYHVEANLSYAANATGLRVVEIKLNGTTVLAQVNIPATPTLSTIVAVGTDFYASATTDYVECIGYQSSGGALNVEVVGHQSPIFSIHRLT